MGPDREEKMPEGDLGRLQGAWTAKAGPDKDVIVSLQIEGRTVRVTIEGADGTEYRARGELRLDDQAVPHALDWVKLESGEQQTIPDLLCIYELTGGQFKVCTGGFYSARPKKFEPGSGVLSDVYVFERATTATADAGSSAKR
jgi:uncharacterized protein (TIGR03067 family)